MDTIYIPFTEWNSTGKLTPEMSDHITKTVGSSNWRITTVGKLGVWVEVKHVVQKKDADETPRQDETENRPYSTSPFANWRRPWHI